MDVRVRKRLLRSERLTRRSHFSSVYHSGVTAHGDLLVVFGLDVRDGGHRIGFVAGRKVGGAVERNRARRCMREAWRDLQHEVRAGMWIVCVARRGASRVPAARIRSELRSLLDRTAWLRT